MKDNKPNPKYKYKDFLEEKSNRPAGVQKLLKLNSGDRLRFQKLVGADYKWNDMLKAFNKQIDNDGIAIVLNKNGQLQVDEVGKSQLKKLAAENILGKSFPSRTSEVTNEEYDNLKHGTLYYDEHQDVFVQYLSNFKRTGTPDTPVVILPCRRISNDQKVLVMSTHLGSGDAEKNAKERIKQATEIVALKNKLLTALQEQG